VTHLLPLLHHRFRPAARRAYLLFSPRPTCGQAAGRVFRNVYSLPTSLLGLGLVLLTMFQAIESTVESYWIASMPANPNTNITENAGAGDIYSHYTILVQISARNVYPS